MSKIYNMSAGEIRTIHMEDYAENEFLIAELDFLGTNPNTHKIKISEEVFRECASSVLGKFLVAKVSYGDATSHAEDEIIQGYIPTMPGGPGCLSRICCPKHIRSGRKILL